MSTQLEESFRKLFEEPAKDFDSLTNARITPAWLRFILYCQRPHPLGMSHGEMTVKIVNGEPTRRISEKPDLRFDRSKDLSFLQMGKCNEAEAD